MIERFDYYDLLGVAVPGVLLAYWIPVCFPSVTRVLGTSDLPEAVDVIGFAAVAIFLGHLMQAIASNIQGLLYRSWGGTPSDRALTVGLGRRYISAATGTRIQKQLAAVAAQGASNQDLFRTALGYANAAPGSRSERFNALYGYHRSLLVVITVALGLLIASRFWGAAENWSDVAFNGAVLAFLIMLGLVWHRSKQRAYEFVQEVLHVAERTLRPQLPQPSSAQAD
jgi:hypothetical protein